MKRLSVAHSADDKVTINLLNVKKISDTEEEITVTKAITYTLNGEELTMAETIPDTQPYRTPNVTLV